MLVLEAHGGAARAIPVVDLRVVYAYPDALAVAADQFALFGRGAVDVSGVGVSQGGSCNMVMLLQLTVQIRLSDPVSLFRRPISFLLQHKKPHVGHAQSTQANLPSRS